MIEPEPCSVSRCRNDSLFSTVGLVGGRFYARCWEHALAAAEADKKRASVLVDELLAVRAEVPGQETLPL